MKQVVVWTSINPMVYQWFTWSPRKRLRVQNTVGIARGYYSPPNRSEGQRVQSWLESRGFQIRWGEIVTLVVIPFWPLNVVHLRKEAVAFQGQGTLIYARLSS